jgi:hypothetical protein
MSIGESRISVGYVVVAGTFAHLERHNRQNAFASLIPISHDFATGIGLVLESNALRGGDRETPSTHAFTGETFCQVLAVLPAELVPQSMHGGGQRLRSM